MAALESKPILPNDGPSVTLTIRLIMQGKEVGSIIGKKGDNIKKFREESGAKINISDGSCPERIVTVTGPTDAIFKAFNLICKKFEENSPNSGTVPKPPITLRLIVPASQCGSLIGKGGSKIKEIREVTGASIQVASDMLPNSTERAVTISGTSEAITQCIYHICCVMMESPPKGATIPYRPKPAMPPVIFAGGQAYTIQGQYAIPHPDADPASCLQLTKLHQLALQHHPILPAHNMTTTGLTPQALAAMAASNHIGRPGTLPAQTQTHEMTIPNDLIGCIIGKGGAKINEIRQLSGATIKISNSEEGSKDRAVTITGVPEAISMAQYLINTSIWCGSCERCDHHHQNQQQHHNHHQNQQQQQQHHNQHHNNYHYYHHHQQPPQSPNKRQKGHEIRSLFLERGLITTPTELNSVTSCFSFNDDVIRNHFTGPEMTSYQSMGPY